MSESHRCYIHLWCRFKANVTLNSLSHVNHELIDQKSKQRLIGTTSRILRLPNRPHAWSTCVCNKDQNESVLYFQKYRFKWCGASRKGHILTESSWYLYCLHIHHSCSGKFWTPILWPFRQRQNKWHIWHMWHMRRNVASVKEDNQSCNPSEIEQE